MDSLLEEYGFVIITAVCAIIMVVAFNVGLTQTGFIGKSILDFAKTIIGG